VTELQGLRERKKARTRASLREHALRLFREHGYTATTVEQIAAAAEVSPSTFFRYFPTKEDVILQDDLDVRIMEAFDRQPATISVIAAIRAAIREAMVSYTEADMALIRETTELTRTVPEIRARAIDEFARSIHSIAGLVAKRSGRAEDDLAVRTVAGAVVGVMMAITLPLWESQATDFSLVDSLGQLSEALALLETGLPLLLELVNYANDTL
jgi:AcrR family transcriptional regulator